MPNPAHGKKLLRFWKRRREYLQLYRVKHLTLLLFILWGGYALAQKGSVSGRVSNGISNEPVPFAVIKVRDSLISASADEEGKYVLKNLAPGVYTIEFSMVGFVPRVLYEVRVNPGSVSVLDVELEESSLELGEVEITTSPFSKTAESPVSLRNIGQDEIERNPGGNRDISKVIQSLPGVAGTPSFRNDVIIRGGAPNENRFFIDGIEVPNINHFATQGSSGGPVGMINVNFIKEVDFYTGAFPAGRGNALSSVMEIRLKEGNPERFSGNLTIGASDLGVSFDGPLGKKASGIFSYRRSYLQYLFTALQLPFLPIYNDLQFKIKYRMNAKNELTIIGLGAFDDFELNLDANETPFQKYLLNNLPEYKQWSYTTGAVLKHYREHSYQSLILSHSSLENKAQKYFNNNRASDTNKIQDYVSSESETKLRLESVYLRNGWRIISGVGGEYVSYSNSTFNKISLPSGLLLVNYSSELNFVKYHAFVQFSKSLADNKIGVSGGLRHDGSTYSSTTTDPGNLSPRLSVSWNFAGNFSLNMNAGRYFQLPPYTVLGYRDSFSTLINKNNGVKYIRSDHGVAGLEWNNRSNRRITLEGFFKDYSDYPFLTDDSVCLANLGADFGVIGNAPVTSTSSGVAYGLEFMFQQKLKKGFYGILSYTYVRSEFTDKNGNRVPSSWDNNHLITLTGGKKWGKGWEVGFKWRYLGGGPYTPYDTLRSGLRAVWDVTGRGLPDYDLLNTERNPAIHQMDVRLDKRINRTKWWLNIYLDVQNVYAFKAELAPYLDVLRDDAGNPVVDPGDPSRYQLTMLKNESGNVLPSIGLTFGF
ncbi:MAG: TonB-dependent receptor [Bacteroidia bacterium]|nr:TonB-dependent receptor [Bacteroidia bacterium]